MNRKWILLALIAAAVAAFFVFDLGQYLQLDYLKSRRDEFAAFRDAQPLAAAGGFFLIYVLTCALSIPGATILTLAAGAVFGLLWGVVLVSFASSVGATLAFLASRYLLRDAIQARYAEKLKAVNEGVARDGAFYLFTLRLLPVFPFFLVNLVMGLTPLRVWVFYAVSQAGMLAATVIYVNAGTQLAKLDSLKGILSPQLLGALVLLGLFPLLARKLVDAVRKKTKGKPA